MREEIGEDECVSRCAGGCVGGCVTGFKVGVDMWMHNQIAE